MGVIEMGNTIFRTTDNRVYLVYGGLQIRSERYMPLRVEGR